MKKNKLIILDRDGVINLDSDHYIKTVDEWIPIESSLKAIALLNKSNYKVAIATNQSGISRGYFSHQTLTDMHNKMAEELAKTGGHIDAIEYCSDHPDNASQFRKPKPGMLLKLINKFNADPAETWFIGDSRSDLECAINAHCKPALVLTGKGQKSLNTGIDNDIPVFNDLADFVHFILSD